MIDDTFAGEGFTVRADDLPGGPAPAVHRIGGDHDGVILQVAAGAAAPWWGVFAFSELPSPAALTQVVPLPGGERLAVVSQGALYVVAAADPAGAQTVREGGVHQALAVPAAGVALFCDHTTIVCFDATGLRWDSARLAGDELRITAVDGDVVRVVGYDPALPGEEPGAIALADGRPVG